MIRLRMVIQLDTELIGEGITGKIGGGLERQGEALISRDLEGVVHILIEALFSQRGPLFVGSFHGYTSEGGAPVLVRSIAEKAFAVFSGTKLLSTQDALGLRLNEWGPLVLLLDIPIYRVIEVEGEEEDLRGGMEDNVFYTASKGASRCLSLYKGEAVYYPLDELYGGCPSGVGYTGLIYIGPPNQYKLGKWMSDWHKYHSFNIPVVIPTLE